MTTKLYLVKNRKKYIDAIQIPAQLFSAYFKTLRSVS